MINDVKNEGASDVFLRRPLIVFSSADGKRNGRADKEFSPI